MRKTVSFIPEGQRAGRASHLLVPASYQPKPPFTVDTRGGTKRYESWRTAIAAAKWASSHVTDADGVVIWAPLAHSSQPTKSLEPSK